MLKGGKKKEKGEIGGEDDCLKKNNGEETLTDKRLKMQYWSSSNLDL